MTPPWRCVRRLELGFWDAPDNAGGDIGSAYDKFAILVAGCPSVQHISGVLLHEVSLQALAGLPALQSLTDACYGSMTISSFTALAQLSTLTHLSFIKDSPPDMRAWEQEAALEAMCSGSLTALADLDIRDMFPSARNCEAVSQLVGLTRLAWRSPAGVSSLLQVAERMPGLCVLELPGAHKSDETMGLVHLNNHPSLSLLEVNMSLDSEAVSRLATCSALTQLRALNGFRTSSADTACLQQLQVLLCDHGTLPPLALLAPGLTSLHLQHNWGLNALHGLTALEQLNWGNGRLNGTGAAVLASLAGSLRHLTIDFSPCYLNEVTGDEVAALTSLTCLVDLRLRSAYGVNTDVTDGELLTLLPALPRLQRLQILEGNCLTDACVAALAAAPALWYVRLGGCKGISPGGIRALAEAGRHRLREVVIASYDFTDSTVWSGGDARLDAVDRARAELKAAWQAVVQQVHGSFTLTLSTNEYGFE